ncbi:predicted protein [Nematostella vectensis]|uniref:Nicotinamide N-methyltransferase-like n=2 Tax=Nematostella vectensis TaxID=45351 RepID=A7RZ46_NEMVE|nr:predicted protein [Nematostella vectensis]|eukprot:XP_001635357.1 predicted protein [Nematostella vectensis]
MEFGGGPTIYSLVSACTHAKGITFCEYNKNNRAAVSAWLEKKKEAFDWSNLFEYIVCELEGKSKDEALKRQDELREKIKIILPCDVKEDDIVKFPEGSQDTRPPFDVVSSSLCLEVAVESDAEYEMVVAKLANFVKPGGYLIMQGVLNESHYTVNGVMFHSFPLTKELIVRSIEMAGMTGIEFKKHECKDDSKDSDHDGLYFVSGVKV